MNEHSGSVTATDPAAGSQSALRQALDRNRQRLATIEDRHREISLEIALAEAELQELEGGGGFSGLLSRLKGNRQGRANDISMALSQKDMERAAVDRELANLRAEVADLERQLREAVGPGRTRQAGDAAGDACVAGPDAAGALFPAPPGAIGDELCRRVTRAIDAAQEARRDILSEVETAATFGRCRVASHGPYLTRMIDGSNDRTLVECATRVQRSMARFMRKYDDVRAAEGGELDPAEQEVMNPLQRYAFEFDPNWLRPDLNDNTFAHNVVENINTAIMLLERRLHTAAQAVG